MKPAVRIRDSFRGRWAVPDHLRTGRDSLLHPAGEFRGEALTEGFNGHLELPVDHGALHICFGHISLRAGYATRSRMSRGRA